MGRIRPKTRTVKASEARQNWSKLLNSVHDGDLRVLVEKDGIAVAGIVSAVDLERLRLLEEERARSFAVIDELREAFRDIPDDQLDQEIERAVSEARLEIKAERRAAQQQ